MRRPSCELSPEGFSGRVLDMLGVAVALIATLTILLGGGMSPAGAHQRSGQVVTAAPQSGSAVPAVFEVRPAAGDQGFSWPFALAIALVAISLVRGRSRKVVVAALAIVLCVFAVESAQHSVHHTFDDQPAACPTALVAGQLSGTTVEPLTLEVPLGVVATRLDTFDPRASSLCSLDPQHGRAPPSALV